MNWRKKAGSILLMSILVLTQVFVLMPNTVEIYAEEVSEVSENLEGVDTTASPEAASAEDSDQEQVVDDPELEESTATPSTEPVGAEETSAPVSEEDDAADIRMVFTTDLHGQLTSMNYETGAIEKEGSLARAATLIAQARQEAGSENTLLFDVGDVLYDYSTDYIYDQDDRKVQPIYKAMATLGYDAITLGNHDFDYTLTYIKQQLQLSGLESKCVVSNVKMVNTGKNIWNENMILTRKVKTKNGKEMTVKIGVIGETIPSLSSKRTDYTGVVKGEDIIESATEQADKLKKQGADIVVVLAHSGLGTEKVSYMTHNVAYALSQVENVDVVLAGHQHKYFPYYGNGKEIYYSYAGYDKETRLVNGKNLVMIPDKGKAIGIVDLTVKQDKDEMEIVDRKSSIRKATAKVEINQKINNDFLGDWQRVLDYNANTILGEMENGEHLENYFGLLEDNGVIQMLNDVKTEYAMQYINNVKTQYKSYPIVSASTYLRYGLDSSQDYIDVSGSFLKSYLSGIYKYKGLFCIYTLTGKQLREWVEWSASAYETAGENILVTGSAVSGLSSGEKKEELFMEDEDMDDMSGILSYDGEKSLQNILNKSWENNWANFYMFDGIEYEIDNSVKPRYDRLGNKINSTYRVTSLTRNGNKIKDEDKFIFICDQILANNRLQSEVAAQKIYKSTDMGQEVLRKYIEKESLNGNIKDTADHNWNVKFSDHYNYVIKSGEVSEDIAKQKTWFQKILETENGFNYYLADMSEENIQDVSGPNIVATKLNEAVTNKDVTVKVQATDVSGVANLQYVLGRFSANANVWNYADKITSSAFKCSENGIYSILAEDIYGNKTVKYIRITNINKSVLQAPVVNTFSNRKATITGTAEANATIYFELSSGKVYKSKVNSKGEFSYKISYQKAESVIYVYVVDSKGRSSARTIVTVKRTGPNRCTLNDVNSNSKTVSGTTNDTYVSLALLVDNSTIYVSKNGGKESYLNSTLYNSKYKVVEISMSIKSKGAFSFNLPMQPEGGSVMKAYNIDRLGRVSSARKKTVVQKVPNRPQVVNSVITNKTYSIKVYNGEKCKIVVRTGDKNYTSSRAVLDSKLKKYAYTVKIPGCHSVDSLWVYAENSKGKSTMAKFTRKLAEPKIDSIRAGGKTIHGYVTWGPKKNQKTKIYFKINGKIYGAVVRSNGKFLAKVPKLKKGTTVCYWAKDKNGSGIAGKITV